MYLWHCVLNMRYSLFSMHNFRFPPQISLGNVIWECFCTRIYFSDLPLLLCSISNLNLTTGAFQNELVRSNCSYLLCDDDRWLCDFVSIVSKRNPFCIPVPIGVNNDGKFANNYTNYMATLCVIVCRSIDTIRVSDM